LADVSPFAQFPLLSILLAVITVSPRYRIGIFQPQLFPATTGPVMNTYFASRIAGSPSFPDLTLRLPDKVLHFKAALTVFTSGKPSNRHWLTHCTIIKHRLLVFDLSMPVLP